MTIELLEKYFNQELKNVTRTLMFANNSAERLHACDSTINRALGVVILAKIAKLDFDIVQKMYHDFCDKVSAERKLFSKRG